MLKNVITLLVAGVAAGSPGMNNTPVRADQMQVKFVSMMQLLAL